MGWDLNVLQRFRERYNRNYLRQIERSLNEPNRPLRLLGKDEAIEKIDAKGWLTLMERKWKDVFADRLGYNKGGYVSELLTARDKWARQNPFTGDDVHRIADTATRLLKAVGAREEAEGTRKIAENYLLHLSYMRREQESNKEHESLNEAPATVIAERNNAAFVVGVLGGIFGLLGTAHIFNHKVLRGLVYLFVGTVCYWIFLLFLLTALVNIGSGLWIAAVALHLVIIWQHAKRGASSVSANQAGKPKREQI